MGQLCSLCFHILAVLVKHLLPTWNETTISIPSSPPRDYCIYKVMCMGDILPKTLWYFLCLSVNDGYLWGTFSSSSMERQTLSMFTSPHLPHPHFFSLRKLSQSKPGLFWNAIEQISSGQEPKMHCHTALCSEMGTVRCPVAQSLCHRQQTEGLAQVDYLYAHDFWTNKI